VYGKDHVACFVANAGIGMGGYIIKELVAGRGYSCVPSDCCAAMELIAVRSEGLTTRP
jgi:hypothetical protein